MGLLELDNKVALVSGSSRGIGRTCAIYLARAGATVAINYKADKEAGEEVCREIESLGKKAFLVQCDVSQRGAAEEFVKTVEKEFGRIDILVNNVGTGSALTAQELTDDEYERVFNTNVRAYANTVHAVLPGMKARRWGRIICIASVAGRSGKAFLGTSPAYAASKGAVISFTRSLARECGPYQITANTVCPGWIDWPGIKRKVPEEVRARAVSEMPIGRVGSAEDVAGAVVYLASSLADYVTGVALDVNGGLYMA